MREYRAESVMALRRSEQRNQLLVAFIRSWRMEGLFPFCRRFRTRAKDAAGTPKRGGVLNLVVARSEL